MEKIKDKNPRNKDGWTPLHCSATIGHYLISKILMEKVADKNPKNHYGTTPLHYAAVYGHEAVCKLIVQNVEDKNPRNDKGWTPLHCTGFVKVYLHFLYKCLKLFTFVYSQIWSYAIAPVDSWISYPWGR